MKPTSDTVKVLQPVGAVNDTTGEIEILGKSYYLQLHPGSYKLIGWEEANEEGTVYERPANLASCDCADSTYREGRPGGCKRVRAPILVGPACRAGPAQIPLGKRDLPPTTRNDSRTRANTGGRYWPCAGPASCPPRRSRRHHP